MDIINEILHRGTVDLIEEQELETVLRSGKKLKVKFGIDPTGSDLHLGHAVPLRKLAQFQKAGHHIQLLFGTFTAKIGDPTGKSTTRPPLTDADIAENIKTYLDQAGKILDISKIQLTHNGDWFRDMSFDGVVKLAAKFTVAQMMERDMFQERLKKAQPISLHELLYPLMQGYDSVVLECDLEIGGTDQLFNLHAGRHLQREFGQKPQSILTVPILEGLDGKEKMSKSLGNFIGIMESPREQFGKTMSIPDELIWKYFELVTDLPIEDITVMKKSIEQGGNPRDAKIRLGKEIVSLYHSTEAANTAEREFVEMFANKGRPDEVERKSIEKKKWKVIDLLLDLGTVESKGEARRMIEGGGVKIDDRKVENIEETFTPSDKPILFKVGKRKFVEVVAE